MAYEESSDVEDLGRKESQKLLKNKSRTPFMNDVHEQVKQDYDEAIEMLKDQHEAFNNPASNFLSALDSIIGDDTQQSSNERIRNFDKLQNAADLLIKLSKKANRVISSEHDGPNTYKQARKEDQERVKDILGAGKRVFDGELDAVVQQAKAKQSVGGKGEAAAQAIAVFGEGTTQAGEGDETEKALRCVQKGVRKMTKALDSAVIIGREGQVTVLMDG
ncbi:hypothetical protein LTR37_002710 [Vermiconidia calcicola]|uniref:Uncharacterized protein n=1 Tax=Vermiconidia calcicola TaxID=1690605 RepID=A0ACC3NUD6_9PEZI|nr:hypothetical protein LTR37_002710 [Vermiconidia calcicola]